MGMSLPSSSGRLSPFPGSWAAIRSEGNSGRKRVQVVFTAAVPARQGRVVFAPGLLGEVERTRRQKTMEAWRHSWVGFK